MQEFKRFQFAVGQRYAAMCRPTVVVKLKVISFKIFKSKISTTHVALNIGSKAGSSRNATIFAFGCKTYVRHCKEHAPIYMCFVAPETRMMSSVIADCPDLVPPQYFGQVSASDCNKRDRECSFEPRRCSCKEFNN